MLARLLPLYFESVDEEFYRQVENLKVLLSAEAEIMEPVALGSAIPEAEAVVFPQLLGEIYRKFKYIKTIRLPILIITSEFCTLSMWDWEIINFLQSEGIPTLAPYTLEQARNICKGLAVKRDLRQAKLLVFQDNPGKGFQASIFKRFYWWEDECTQRMVEKYGITIVKKSLQELGVRIKAFSDQEAQQVWQQWSLKTEGVSKPALFSAIKLYLAIRDELDQDEQIRGVGINCLNESHFLDTTPCLAWNILHEERRLIWGCEGDTLSMLTLFILRNSLQIPIMMTNLYPFLLGQAALKHERIPDFPDIPQPENCILVAHCGYLGVLPVSLSIEWMLRPKVLAIVDPNATAIDARLPVGEITLAKLDATLKRMTVVEGALENYVQYPGSDCINGGIIRVADGHRLMRGLSSHHYLLMTGHHRVDIEILSKIFELEVEAI